MKYDFLSYYFKALVNFKHDDLPLKTKEEGLKLEGHTCVFWWTGQTFMEVLEMDLDLFIFWKEDLHSGYLNLQGTELFEIMDYTISQNHSWLLYSDGMALQNHAVWD